jgi:hypothetical protein
MSDKKAAKKSSHEKPHEMHIKRADGGGFVVTHHPKKKHNDVMGGGEDTTHVISDPDQLASHVQDAMSDQPAAGQAPPAQDPNAPPQGAAPAAPPQGM